MAEAEDLPKTLRARADVTTVGRDVLVLVAVSLGAALAFYLPYALRAPVIDGYPCSIGG